MALQLIPSAVRTVSGNSGALANLKPERISGALFQLAVTAAATAAGDTLNVYIQHSGDNGTTWDDFLSFTQVLGNGGVKNFIAGQTEEGATPAALHPVADGSLAAGTVNQGPLGDLWRVKWVVVNGTAASFTFAVFCSPQPFGRAGA